MCVSGSVSMSVFVCLGGSSQAFAHGLWLRGSMYKSRHKFGQIEAYIYNVLYVCIPVLGSCRLQKLCTTRVVYAIRAFMYHSTHKYTILQVCCKGFNVPLQSCMK